MLPTNVLWITLGEKRKLKWQISSGMISSSWEAAQLQISAEAMDRLLATRLASLPPTATGCHSPLVRGSRYSDSERGFRDPAARAVPSPSLVCKADAAVARRAPERRGVVDDDAVVQHGDNRGLVELSVARETRRGEDDVVGLPRPGARAAFTSGGYAVHRRGLTVGIRMFW